MNQRHKALRSGVDDIGLSQHIKLVLGGRQRGFGCRQPFQRTLAELVTLFARAPRRRVGGPGAYIFPHTGDDAHHGAQHARAANREFVAPQIHKARQAAVTLGGLFDHLRAPPPHHGQHLCEAERTDHRGDQPDPAIEFLNAEVESDVGVNTLRADHGDHQTQKASNIPFQRADAAGQLARNDDTEDGKPEELERAKAQRSFCQGRRKQHEQQNAHQRAQGGPGSRERHRVSRAASLGQRIAIK